MVVVGALFPFVVDFSEVCVMYRRLVMPRRPRGGLVKILIILVVLVWIVVEYPQQSVLFAEHVLDSLRVFVAGVRGGGGS